jgi:hemerythrin
MNGIKWDKTLEIGVPSIDADHQNIIAWINDIQEMGNHDFPHKTLVYVLDCLIDYVAAHFRHEEQVMQACAYGGLEAHKLAHEKFEEKINQIHSQLMNNSQSVVSEEVIGFLVQWLADHIVNVDALMIPYVRGNKAALLDDKPMAAKSALFALRNGQGPPA